MAQKGYLAPLARTKTSDNPLMPVERCAVKTRTFGAAAVDRFPSEKAWGREPSLLAGGGRPAKGLVIGVEVQPAGFGTRSSDLPAGSRRTSSGPRNFRQRRAIRSSGASCDSSASTQSAWRSNQSQRRRPPPCAPPAPLVRLNELKRNRPTPAWCTTTRSS